MKNRRIKDRIISVILSVVMLFGLLPAGVMFASTDTFGAERITDAHTLDQWMQYFGTQTDNANGVSLSTEFAGGVWTDKSVFTPDNLPSQITDATYNGNSIAVTDKGDNFYVALSAIASNKEIKGYSTIPTDTVLVLDMSSSMGSADDLRQSAVDELVMATNKAITELLSINNNNRIAVVAYAGNEAKSFGVDSDGITRVIMPLDRYTSNNGTYLVSKNVGFDQNRAIEIASGVKNSDNKAMSANRFEISTSTYMQDGIYEAMKLLLNAETTVTEGVQMGTKRLPIMVLMTDGEPTLASNDYNGNNDRTDLGKANLNDYSGDTGTYSHRDTIAFVTSLTAAFAKKEIEKHYGRSALMYTLPYGTAVLNRPEALSVLNPEKSSTTQNALWNSFLNGERVTVFRKGNRQSNYQYIYATNSTVDGEKLFAEDRMYVDRYFPAENDEAMLKAFEDIVAEIVIQSKYYPTYVESDHDHDGYLTFVDKIGKYMEVTDVSGIIVGDRLFSGAALASYFPANFSGNISEHLTSDMINSVKERLGIDNDAVASALIQAAYTHKQVYYNSPTDFDHYIGWFSDADGNYIDFWHKEMTSAQYAEAKAKGATHVIRSYAFMGDTRNLNGVSSANMMYMSVRIATDIDTAESIVTWRIPASLVPTVTYLVDVEVDTNGKITNVLNLELDSESAESPIRLVYNVEMRGDIADWNIASIVDEEYLKENGYTFYTNKWSADANDTSLNTYSHFEPSVQNERYYYTEDTVVMVSDGNGGYVGYVGTKPSGNGYYREYQVFEKMENGTLRVHKHHEPISAEAMQSVKPDGDNWVIPKDTVHRYYDYEVTEKAENSTNTMLYSDHPFVINEHGDYYTYSTQGNNGKITITPATGIKLTKTLASGYTTDNSFEFVIDGDISGALVVRLDGSGKEASRTAIDESGTIELSAGETVYVIGLAEGEYKVVEKIPAGADYRVESVSVNGQLVSEKYAQIDVVGQTITEVGFTNTKQGYGTLVVSKDVNYPDGFAPTDDHNNKEFTINVTFNGDISAIIAPDGAVKNGSTYTVVLKDGESVTFSNIIEGVTYDVVESDIPDGYDNKEIRFSNQTKAITAGITDQAHVVNDYAPSSVSASVVINGTKTVEGQWPVGAEFNIKLLEITDLSSGNVIDTGLAYAVTADNAEYEIDMSSIVFDKVGTYYFRVVEEIPEDRIPDMAYDRTFGMFAVTVTDSDADGALEIGEVVAYGETQLSQNGNGYVITKNFVNIATTDIVYVNVNKVVADANDGNVTYNGHRADIAFGLFDSMESDTPAYYVITDANGDATFAIPVTKDALGTEGRVYYLRELAPEVEDRVVGMHYDESWFGAVRITWDDAENTAVTEYADIKNGVVGDYRAYDAQTDRFVHVNTYESDEEIGAELELSGTKTLNGKTDLGGREFSFNLYETTAAFVIKGDAIQTVTNNKNAIVFDSIKLNTVGLHYFSVKENPSELGGIANDENHYHITVLVEKFVDTDGVTRLRIAEGYPVIHSYGDNESVARDALDFDNTYTVSGDATVEISGKKTLLGRPMLNGEFRFALVEVADADGTELDNAEIIVAENGSAENGVATFTFEPITYTEIGEHYYVATEVHFMGGNGITYSNAVYTVLVTVADNGNGGLDASWEVLGGGNIEFVNVYDPADVKTEIHGVKELEGKVLNDGEFKFILTQTESDFITEIENGDNREMTNDANGIINFGEFNYTAVGTYYYTACEYIPEETDGIEYDTTVYYITVTVTDNHRGSLETDIDVRLVTVEDVEEVVIPASTIVFVNKFTEPEPDPDPDPDPNPDPDESHPKPTPGDDSNVFGLFVMLIASLGAMMYVIKKKTVFVKHRF